MKWPKSEEKIEIVRGALQKLGGLRRACPPPPTPNCKRLAAPLYKRQ